MTVSNVLIECPNCKHIQEEEVHSGDKIGWWCDRCDKCFESTPERTERHLFQRLNLPAFMHKKGCIVN
jgi:hypothetical protein